MILNGASQATVERYIWLLGQADTLQRQWAAVRDYRNYYGGKHPVFLTPRQEEFLGPLLTNAEHTLCLNLCKPVVDTIRERLKIEGFTGKDAAGEKLAEKLAEWWRKAKMDLHQITNHRRTLRDGCGYLITDWNAEGQHPQWIPNRKYDGVEGLTFHRDPDTLQPTMAIKYWSVSDPLSDNHGQKRRTVYLPDRILRYKQDPKGDYGWSLIDPAEGQPLQWWVDPMPAEGMAPAPNAKPLGVACVEWQEPGGVSALEDVIGPQNATNKTWLDLIAAADATGFQMLTVSYEGPLPPAEADDENKTSDDLQIAPGRILELANKAQMGVIPPGDLMQLINKLHTDVASISAITKIPQYYLWPLGGSEVPSGEALKQLESGLEAKAEERTILYGDAWCEAMRLGARLYRAMGYSDVDPEGQIEANWGSVAVRNEFIQAQIAEAHQRLNVPQEVIWERLLNYTPDDVTKFKRMRAQEEARQLSNVITSLGGMNGAGNRSNGNGADNRATVGGAGSNGATGRANG